MVDNIALAGFPTTLGALVNSFGEAATYVAMNAGMRPSDEATENAQPLIAALVTASDQNTATLALLRIADYALSTAFETVASIEGAQDKILTLVPQDLGSDVNASLIEKYELTGLADLVQKSNGPS